MATKWLVAAGLLILLALATPAAVDAWNGWTRHADVQEIHYIPREVRDINELSASRRHMPRSRQSD